MNLHGIANPYIATVNPNVAGTYKASAGAVTGRAGKRQPKYTTFTDVPMQVQALTAKEVAHLDALNIQGVVRSVYMNGNVQGLNRVEAKGGDILEFNGKVWLVAIVFETWDQSGWCKVGVTLQAPPPNVP